MYREQYGEYGYWYLGVKRSWLTFMASIAYSTWKRRPSGEKVLTPLKKYIYINSIYCLLPLCIYELANGKISDSQEADQCLKSQRLRLINFYRLSTHNYEPFIQGVKRYNELQENVVLGFQVTLFLLFLQYIS